MLKKHYFSKNTATASGGKWDFIHRNRGLWDLMSRIYLFCGYMCGVAMPINAVMVGFHDFGNVLSVNKIHLFLQVQTFDNI